MGRVFANATALLAGNTLLRVFGALISVLLIRELGSEDYGMLAAALSVAQIISFFTDAGLNHTFLREASRPGADIKVLTSSTLILRLGIALLLSLALLPLVYLIYSEEQLRTLTILVAIPSVWASALQGVGSIYFQLKEKMHITAIVQFVSGTIAPTCLLVGIILRVPLEFYGPVYGLAGLASGVLAIFMVRRDLGGFTRKISLSQLSGIAAFMVGGLFATALPQLGPIILTRVATIADVGDFSVALRIPSVLYLIPGAVVAAFYPVLHKTVQSDQDSFWSILSSELEFMSIIGIAVALPCSLYAGPIVAFLFGANYVPRVSNIMVLVIWIVALQALSYPLAHALITQDRAAKRAWVLWATLLIAFPLYSILGRQFGAFGGGLSVVICELAVFLGYAMTLPRGLKWVFNVVRVPLLALGVACLMGLITAKLSDNFWLGGPFVSMFFLSMVYVMSQRVRGVVYGLMTQTNKRLFGRAQ